MIRKLQHFPRKILLASGIFLLIIIGSRINANAQAAIGAKELAMGGATTVLQETSWAMFGNPAMMDSSKSTVSFFGVRYFGFAEITDMAVSITHPTKIGVFGAAAHRYGFDLFSENKIRLGYKHALMGFHFGGVVSYNHVSQDIENGSAGAIGLDLGVAAPIISGLWIGARASNINQPKYGKLNNEKLPRDLSIGLSYRLSKVAIFSADVYKDVQFPISYRGGLEMTIIGGFVGRAGVTTAPQTFTGGFGYMGSFWSANVAVQRHENQVLGYSPAVDFQISW